MFEMLKVLIPVVLMAGACAPVPETEAPPNIILVLADDLGWTDLGVTGSTFYLTPNIDRLASEGLRFTSAYSNAPNCAPSRASMLTGLYTPRHHIFTVASSERGESKDRKIIPTPNTTTLDTSFVTLAEVLRGLGYATGSFGKWHLGSTGNLPEDQGFDVNVEGRDAGAPRSHFIPARRQQDEPAHNEQYLTDVLTDRALQFIRQNAETPFFVYLTHYTVHTPIEAPDSLVSIYESRQADSLHNNTVYAAMIHGLDTSVGRVVALVDSLELSENTTILFFSDNGGHGAITSNAPLRGAKGMLYEGGIRVPLIIRSKEVASAGSTTDVPAIGLDLFPTVIELAGGNVEQWPHDGRSLLPVVGGEQRLHRDALYWHFPVYLEAYSGGLSDGPWRITPSGAIREGDWKLIEHFEDGTIELYNLAEDLGESNDLSEAHPDIAADLLEKLRAWRTSTDAPVPNTLNPEYQPENK